MMAGSTRRPLVGVSYMYEPEFNRAILPLLESGEIDALEWSFDTVADHRSLPDWMQGLLRAYSDASRLYGHGVYYSLFSGTWGPRQQAWLDRLRRVQGTYSFRHISEHFGFMSSGHAHRGAPLPVPLSDATAALGIARIGALREAAGVLVGVENLALAFSREDAFVHGDFLRRLVEPVGGFIVLDLHNLYCQSCNFGLPLKELIGSYPLDRVRELHLSGGSWLPAPGEAQPVRRDTHDDAVPEALFSILPWVIARCPNLEVIILERLGDTLGDAITEASFREELRRVKAIVSAETREILPAWPFPQTVILESRLEDGSLREEQTAILDILCDADSAAAAKASLMRHPLIAGTAWRPERWDTAMVDTAMQLGRKWGNEN